jgi:hypothetical protein
MIQFEITEASTKARCIECNAFATEHQFGGRITHTRHCEAKRDQPDWSEIPGSKASKVMVKHRLSEIQKRARMGEISSIAAEDEIVDLVRGGHISMSDAMNRDF